MFLRLLAAALLCVLMTHNADARPRHGHHHRHHPGVRDFRTTQHIGRISEFVLLPDFPAIKPMPFGLRRVMAEGAGRVVGGRPRGCPKRYCGCGASLHVFGRIIPSLNLAANWLRFPRAMPAPGMVAARRGHVFVLERHMRGNVWHVFDANSGRHRTRVHPRSIAGFRIVNPYGSRLALQ